MTEQVARTQWTLSLSDTERRDTQVDQATATLRSDLAAIRLISVEPSRSAPASGSKSATAVVVGELVASGFVDIHTVAAIRDVLLAALRRPGSRTITLRDGTRSATIRGYDGTELTAAADVIDAFFR